jgi:hypothetical protein
MEPEVKSELKPSDVGDAPLYCKNHPRVETRLRCNRCGEPICIKCARRTPVGFRCPQCLHTQQAVFYTATITDYVIAAVIAFILGGIAAFLMGYMGWFIPIFLGPIAGGLIAEAVHRGTGGRRGHWIGVMVVACLVVSALVALIVRVPAVFLILLGQPENATFLLRLVLGPFNVIYLVLASAAAFARLR